MTTTAAPITQHTEPKETAMPKCDMREECAETVTHIGSGGWVYCAAHAIVRRHSGYESTRKLRGWEIHYLRTGRALPSYKPTAQPVPVLA